MKNFLFLALSCLTLSAFADIIRCPMLSDSDHLGLAEGNVVIHFRKGPNKIFVDKIEAVGFDGEFEEPINDELFGQDRRGGWAFSYCNPDDRGYLESQSAYFWDSTCSPKGWDGRLLAEALLSTKAEGYVRTKALFLSGGTIEREIRVDLCK